MTLNMKLIILIGLIVSTTAAALNETEYSSDSSDSSQISDTVVTYLRKPNIKQLLSDRIVGGQDATRGQFPYQLSLRYARQHICGASILSEKHGLTAAHCHISNALPRNYDVLAGTNAVHGIGFLSETTPLARFIVHESFNTRTFSNDIALLVFARELRMRGFLIQPITLPQANSPTPADGSRAVVSGWGTTAEDGTVSERLKFAWVPIIDTNECNRKYAGKIDVSSMFCAGYRQGGVDSCQGDSGGPFVQNGVQIGIVSWGNGCARAEYPGVYTKVSNYIRWLETKANGL